MLRIFAPLRINYGLVSTSLIITTSAISTSIIAINYDLYSALKQLLKPVIDKIQSAIEYLGLKEGLLKLHEQVEKAFQSLKNLDLLSGLKTLFEKLKSWIKYLSEKLPEWLQWEKFLRFLDWLYVVIKSITDIFYEIEWKELWSLIFTKEFWELTDSLGWIVSKTGGLENWSAEDFKEILKPVVEAKNNEDRKQATKQLLDKATQTLQEIARKLNSQSSSSDSKQQANEAKRKLTTQPAFIKELVDKILKIIVAKTSGLEEHNKNEENIKTIATGVDKLVWALFDNFLVNLFEK